MRCLNESGYTDKQGLNFVKSEAKSLKATRLLFWDFRIFLPMSDHVSKNYGLAFFGKLATVVIIPWFIYRQCTVPQEKSKNDAEERALEKWKETHDNFIPNDAHDMKSKSNDAMRNGVQKQ